VKEATQMNSRGIAFNEFSVSGDCTTTHSSSQFYPSVSQVTDEAAPVLFWGSDCPITHIVCVFICCWASD